MVGPPGFGKTCLLAAWHALAEEQGLAAAWFKCDPHDDAAGALAYIAAGLGAHFDAVAEETGGDIVRTLQALIASIDGRQGPCHLFIDDFLASSEAVRSEVLYPLLRLAPKHLRIVLTLEQMPAAIERYVDHVVDRRILRFGLEDVRALCGRGVTAHRARAILRQSQGWPALAAMLIDQYRRTGADARPARFVRTRLMPFLSQEDIVAVRHLASIDAFDLNLARLVATDAVIERLIELGVVAPVSHRDARGYVVNPMLAALLVGREPEEAGSVKARAARDLLARRHFVAATRLAVEIGDEELLTDIIDACDPVSTFLGQGIAPLERIVALIPPDMARRNLQVSCAALVALLKTGHLRQARAIFGDVETRFASVLSAQDISPKLQVQVLIAKSLLNIHQGRDISEEDYRALGALAGRMSGEIGLLETVAAMLRTHMHQIFGELSAARRSAEHGVRASMGGAGRYATFFHYFDIAVIDGVQGRRQEARAELARISSAYRDILRLDPRIAVIRDAFRIELEHEDDPGDLGEAGRLRTICRKLPTLEGWPDVFYAAYRTYSEKLFLAGDTAGALALLDAGSDYARREDVAPLLFVLDHQRALIAVMAGQIALAQMTLEPYRGQTVAAVAKRPWREIEVCVEARAAMATHRPDPTFARLLAMARRHAQQHGNMRLGERCGLLSRKGARGLRLTIEAQAAPDRPAEEGMLAHLLTPRSREVIAKLRDGLTDKEIGIALGISPHGVRYHLKRAYAQMHVETRAQALLKAGEAGLLA